MRGAGRGGGAILVVGEGNAKLIYNYVGSDFIDFRFKNLLISGVG